MAKNKLSDLIASEKMLNIDFINKHIMNLETGVGAIKYYSITNHLPQKIFRWSLPNYFSL